jgi:hybrid cluster-associated redox disulfide protein
MGRKNREKAKKEKITKNMTFAEILQNHPKSAEILFNSGLHCVGCHISAYETLEQGCLMHGMDKKQISELIKKLNKTK